MVSKVENIWKELTSEMEENVSCNWWTELLKKYNEGNRSYHNVDHLLEKFDHYRSIKPSLKNPNAVAFAIFFHYFEYDPKSVDCEEKNVEHFTKFSEEGRISKNTELCTEVVHLLHAAATHSTDEHKTGGVFGNEDRHYFLDIDMAVLGSDSECYAEYITKVRQEYDFLPDFMYNSLRLKVLQNFLQIPNIFASKEFREKFEVQARLNIQHEVDRLKP